MYLNYCYEIKEVINVWGLLDCGFKTLSSYLFDSRFTIVYFTLPTSRLNITIIIQTFCYETPAILVCTVKLNDFNFKLSCGNSLIKYMP